jgi:hypothetical protein
MFPPLDDNTSTPKTKKYRVELHDGRKFDVETDGEPPNENDILPYLNKSPNLPDVGPGNRSEDLTIDDRLKQAKESLAKPPVWSDTSEIGTDKKSDNITQNTGESDKSFARKAWNFASSPLSDYITYNGQKVFAPHEAAEYYDQPSKDRGVVSATLHGLGAGLLEGAGNVLSGFTSPINVAMTAAGASGYNNVAKALSAPLAAEGAYHTFGPDMTTEQRLMGIPEMAGAALPFLHGGAPVPHTEGPEIIPPEYNRGPRGDILDVNLPENRPERMLPEANRGLPSMPPIEQQGPPGLPPASNYIFDETGRPIAPADINQPTTSDRPSGPWDTNIAPPTPETDVNNALYEAATRNYQLRNLGLPPDVAPQGRTPFEPQFQPHVEGEHGLPAEYAPDIRPASGMSIPTQEITPPENSPRDLFSQIQQDRPPTGFDWPEIGGRMEPNEQGSHTLMSTDRNNLLSTGEEMKARPGGYASSQEPPINPDTSRPNLAVGGASPRVLNVLGSSLYSKRGPQVALKELIQNSADEHRIVGQKAPIKVLHENASINPDTGEESPSITVRDFGRGLTPEQLYTVFSDVGETGKESEESASGGFGFAKAAPMLAGKYFKAISVIDEGGKRVKYTFEGTPEELKNQEEGVAVRREEVPKAMQTGLRVTAWYPKNADTYGLDDLTENMSSHSPSITSPIHYYETYNTPNAEDNTKLNQYLETPSRYPDAGAWHPINKAREFPSVPQPTLRDTLEIPGAKINLHYDTRSGESNRNYNIHYQNKGLYQFTDQYNSYGREPIPNAPAGIKADIIATAKEGSEDYPFTANREQVVAPVKRAIKEWVDENIIKGAAQKRQTKLAADYKAIEPLNSGVHGVAFLDSGNLFKPKEVRMFQGNEVFNAGTKTMEDVHVGMMNVAERLRWTRSPSNKLEKFGVLFKGPTEGSTTMGIHIPNPESPLNKSTILINVMEHINHALEKNPDDPLDHFSTALFSTMAHEIAHIPEAGHDEGHSYRDADLRSAMGGEKTIQMIKDLRRAYGDESNADFHPEIHKLLQIYNESRSRGTSAESDILATGEHIKRPATESQRKETGDGNATRSSKGPIPTANIVDGPARTFRLKDATPGRIKDAINKGYKLSGFNPDGSADFYKPNEATTGGGGKGNQPPNNPILEEDVGGSRPRRQNLGGNVTLRSRGNIPTDAMNAVRAIRASGDLSAPFRQGIGLIHTKAWWTNWGKMVSSFGSEAAFEASQAAIAERPLFKRRIVKGREIPSFAEDAGLKLTDIHGDLGGREEAFMTNIAKRYPFVERSERAYVTFLNNLRADNFEALVKSGKIFGSDATTNIPRARVIADYVNNASGRGNLGKFEGAAQALNTVFFSPRLFASRLQMLNPRNYVMGDPFVRTQYWKSLLGVVAATQVVNQLGKLGGGTVETNPASSDFNKLKIGNTRVDPAGGFNQYLVLAERMIPTLKDIPGLGPQIKNIPVVGHDLSNFGGHFKSTTTGREYNLSDPGFGRSTRGDVLGRFAVSKLNPVLGFGWGLINGMKNPISGQAYDFKSLNPLDNTIMQMYIPMVAEDIGNVLRKEPYLLPLVTPAAITGMGTQEYERHK